MNCPEIFGKISRYRRIWKLFIAAFTFKHKSKQNYSQRCEIVITFLDSARPRTCFDMSTSSTQNPCNRNPFSLETFRECWWMQNMTWYCVNEKGTGGLLGFRFGKRNISAFTGKKIIPLSCLEKILGFVTYLPSKWVYPPIFRCAIFVVFSALFERKSKLQTKIQLRKASWRPPGFQIWKKQYHSFHWKKNYPIIFFWTK